jgi:hypothetical protein
MPEYHGSKSILAKRPSILLLSYNCPPPMLPGAFSLTKPTTKATNSKQASEMSICS